MILSDRDIDHIIKNGEHLLVNPYNDEMLQPNSIDLTLGDELLTLTGKSIDLSYDTYKLKPNEFLLGATMESIHIPLDLVGHIDGKSSIGRLGVFIHVSSGFIDSGFNGNVTLEIYNCSDKEFELYQGMSICQIVFQTLTSPVIRPYGHKDLDSHYQDSVGVVESRYEGYR